MISEKDKKFLRKQFKGLALGTIKPENTRTGICNHLFKLYCSNRIDLSGYRHAKSLMKHWPAGTRSSLFPVSAFPLVSLGGFRAEEAFRNTNNLWVGRYGERRKALCLWLSRHEDLI